MKFSSDELIPFSDARSGLSRIIADVLAGREFVVKTHGKMTVAFVTVSQLYQYREMEREVNEYLAALDQAQCGGDANRAFVALKKRIASKWEDFGSYMSKVLNVPPLQRDKIQKKLKIGKRRNDGQQSAKSVQFKRSRCLSRVRNSSHSTCWLGRPLIRFQNNVLSLTVALCLLGTPLRSVKASAR